MQPGTARIMILRSFVTVVDPLMHAQTWILYFESVAQNYIDTVKKFFSVSEMFRNRIATAEMLFQRQDFGWFLFLILDGK